MSLASPTAEPHSSRILVRSLMHTNKLLLLALIHLFFVFFTSNYASADCQGCCSRHGGVVCLNGVTQCGDGTPLSATCIAKGCDECDSDSPSNPTPTPQPDPIVSDLNKINIASFNIQVFGTTKAGKPEVMDSLGRILTKFDIIAIQEIRDASGTAIQDLEQVVDSFGTDYQYIIGPRLGRTSSKEQYAFFFKTSTITTIQAYTFDDSENDLFHREPFIAQFITKNGNFDFVLIAIHTDPDEATDEINALTTVIADAKDHFVNELDFIILGDLNADCSYFNETDFSSPLRASDYNWIITNDMDTNIAASDCTYDRIIITSSTNEDYCSSSGVYLFDQILGLDIDQAKDVSDHYPVWGSFFVNEDSDTQTPDGSNDGTDTTSSDESSGGGGGGGCFIECCL